MAYSKTAWTDRAVQYPSRFTMVTNADGTITLTPSPGTITTSGTPLTAANLNNIENGIYNHEIDTTNPHQVTSQQVNYLPEDAHAVTDGPTSYPIGISVFEVTNGTGWPTNLGIVQTNYLTLNRAFQIYVGKTSGVTLVRSADNTLTNGWGSWVQFSLLTDFANSKSTNGYQKLPNGLIIQWAKVPSVPNGVLTNYNLPITFPSAFLQATTSLINASGACGWNPTSTSQIGLIQTQGSARDMSYIAIGY